MLLFFFDCEAHIPQFAVALCHFVAVGFEFVAFDGKQFGRGRLVDGGSGGGFGGGIGLCVGFQIVI